jgi:EpsI family protein
VLVGSLAIAAALSTWLPYWEDPGPARLVLGRQIRAEIGDWRSTERRVDRAFMGRPGLRQIIYRRYRSGGDEVDLFVGVGDRSQRFHSAFSPTTELPGSGWMVEEAGTARLAPDGPEVRTSLVRSGGKRRLVYHWYLGTEGLADEILRSALALDSSPLRRAGDGIAVRLSTDWGGPGPEARRSAERRLARFFSLLRVELGALEAQLARKRFSQIRKNRKTFSTAPRQLDEGIVTKSNG